MRERETEKRGKKETEDKERMAFPPFRTSLCIFPLLCLRDRIERGARVGVCETKRKRYVTMTGVARRVVPRIGGGRGVNGPRRDEAVRGEAEKLFKFETKC